VLIIMSTNAFCADSNAYLVWKLTEKKTQSSPNVFEYALHCGKLINSMVKKS